MSHGHISSFNSITVDDKGLHFEKKELSPPIDPEKKDVPYSRLADLLESSVNMGENPFLEYAKFDGKVGFMITHPGP